MTRYLKEGACTGTTTAIAEMGLRAKQLSGNEMVRGTFGGGSDWGAVHLEGEEIGGGTFVGGGDWGLYISSRMRLRTIQISADRL